MFSQPVRVINSWNQDYQTVGIGNYGYGIYSQDVEVHRNPFTGLVRVERDVDFIPIRNSGFGSYANYPFPVHQHYHS